MRFNDAQLEEYRERGYAVVDCPWPEQLTEACLAAVEKVARDPSEGPEDGKRKPAVRKGAGNTPRKGPAGRPGRLAAGRGGVY